MCDLIWPPRCIACDVLSCSDGEICPNCLSQIIWIDTDFSAARLQKVYFDSAKSLALHEGSFERIVHRFKYLSDTSLGVHLGALIARKISREYDVVTCVPLTGRRLLRRGFNQSALLARQVAKDTGFSFQPHLLKRHKSVAPQVGLGAKERIENVRGIFSCRTPETVAGRAVLLIDDVMTTGATANECAKVLKKHGASRVDVFTLSRRPKS